MTEENRIEDVPKNTIDHHQSKLMEFIMSEKATTVQTLVDGDTTGETVREGEYVVEYEIFTLKGVEAKINIDTFETMGERINKMQNEIDEETGKPKYSKDDVVKFIKKWCFNKVKANGSATPTEKDFMTLVLFVEEIVFKSDDKLRTTPPTGISKSKAISKYKSWDSKKFKVKISVDAFVNLENKVRKLRKKGAKKDIYNLEAETEKVAFLQTHMSLKSGEYCSGPEFAAYFKEIYKAMFPATFGIPDKTPDEIEKKNPPHKDQKKITEPDEEQETDDEDAPPVPEKNKRGRPKKE